MDEKSDIFESLFKRAEEYGKTSLELLKLKALDKATDVISSGMSRMVAVYAIATFLLMANLGLALWLGDILGKLWYGFFVVAAFYGLFGVVMYFFAHKSLKKLLADFIIKQVLK
jgi:hypothetical protein